MVLGQCMTILAGTWSVKDGTGTDIRWYKVSKGLVCLYILENWRFGRVTPMPDRQQNIELLSLSKV